jgi:hypothetical protein
MSATREYAAVVIRESSPARKLRMPANTVRW